MYIWFLSNNLNFTWLETHNFILLIRLLYYRCYFLRCLTYGIIWKGFSFKYVPILPTRKCLEECIHYRLNISKSPCWPPGWLYAITISPKQHQVMWYGKTFLACKHCLCIEFKNLWVARMAVWATTLRPDWKTCPLQKEAAWPGAQALRCWPCQVYSWPSWY